MPLGLSLRLGPLQEKRLCPSLWLRRLQEKPPRTAGDFSRPSPAGKEVGGDS